MDIDKLTDDQLCEELSRRERMKQRAQLEESAKVDVFDQVLVEVIDHDNGPMSLSEDSLLMAMLKTATFTDVEIFSNTKGRRLRCKMTSSHLFKQYFCEMQIVETNMVDPRLLEKPDAS